MKKVCIDTQDASSPWPFRIKLSTDHLRWDSLKISPSKGFEEHILANFDAGSRKVVDAWRPIEISIQDVDTLESYKANLVKKQSFWFEPLPDVGEKTKDSSFSKAPAIKRHSSDDLQKVRKEYAYSIEPFRQIAKKRSLRYDQEIGLRVSGCETVPKLEFSVLHAPQLDFSCHGVWKVYAGKEENSV